MIAFIVGLKAEAHLLQRLRLPVFVGGGDAIGAALAADAAIGAGAGALVSFGLAGGLDPALGPGVIVNPRQVIWRERRLDASAGLATALGGFTTASLLAGDCVAATCAKKTDLFERFGAAAIDLESGAVAAAADAAGRPFAVLRAICDPASCDLPPAALGALDATGSIGLCRVLVSVLRRPEQIGGLLRLAGDAGRARRALAAHVATLMAAGGLQKV